ncbi:MAG: protein-L-isoaspartate(D-aspartate) O-methyltransferase [Bacteroidota bacterium]|nr:protein-L-isoaspartate(D-aspartate) O-methyltransferase [Bacteroidota bacterium]MDP4205235.1 protein-L-isoaspartate(D-aspartate) O-methyltransferase [Bacteroidota bacterium]
MIDNFQHKGLRKRLVDGLRLRGIRDERVLEAIGKVPRHLFMESSFVRFAYKDQAFPIGAGQTISQPYTVAIQTQLLEVHPNDKVLEIGTGSGYQAAILLEMGADVYTIERQKELFIRTQKLLPKLGYQPHFFLGDGYKGLPTYGPFDKILVTAGAPFIPEDLKVQLKVGGLMVIPVGSYERQRMFVVRRVSETKFENSVHGDFIFVPLLPGIENQNKE